MATCTKPSRDLQQELGREPRVQEIAERLELTPERVLEIQASSRQPVSLETPLGNEDSAGTLGDLIADRSVRSPHDMAAHSMLRRHMDDAMQVLSPRERQVLRMRYGLAGGREHTLGEIADQLGVTSERVRQIESAALIEAAPAEAEAQAARISRRIRRLVDGPGLLRVGGVGPVVLALRTLTRVRLDVVLLSARGLARNARAGAAR